jgi:hypothetical protein
MSPNGNSIVYRPRSGYEQAWEKLKEIGREAGERVIESLKE